MYLCTCHFLFKSVTFCDPGSPVTWRSASYSEKIYEDFADISRDVPHFGRFLVELTET